MGSAIAPSIANLFMGALKRDFILNSDINPYMGRVKHYYRYINDLVWYMKIQKL